MTPEGKIKAKLKRELDKLPFPVYRFMPVQNGMGAPALDFFLCVNSRFVAIETKAPGKDLTPRQKNTVAEIKAAGGYTFTVSDLESLNTCLWGIRWLSKQPH